MDLATNFNPVFFSCDFRDYCTINQFPIIYKDEGDDWIKVEDFEKLAKERANATIVILENNERQHRRQENYIFYTLTKHVEPNHINKSLESDVQQAGAIVRETNDYLLWYYDGKQHVVVVNEVIGCTKRIDVSRYNSCSSILSFFTQYNVRHYNKTFYYQAS